ncbi:twin-arginine translocase subunit TatC [Thermanaerosceptrum fracticalcis]|nr:twin-arginine translocase subunit TatC [Thermanaerosceptrum fracticalcis]
MIINYVKIVDRLERLRKILIFSAVTVLAVTVLVYWRTDLLITFLARPLGQRQLVFLSPMEGFMTKIQIAFFTALALCLPLILWQAIRLAAPLLGERQKKVFYWVIPLATLLFTVGVVFGFTVITPVTLNFLLETGQAYMTAMLSAGRYFSFVIILSLGMGVVFQLPLIVAVLAAVGIITSRMLREKRKFALLGILLLTALITPTPDIFTLMVASVPVFILYELSILVVSTLEKSSKKRQETLQEV